MKTYTAFEKLVQKEYFTGLMTALSFHSFKIHPNYVLENERKKQCSCWSNCSCQVYKGLDAAIACREGWEARDGKLKQQYPKMIGKDPNALKGFHPKRSV